MNPAPVSLRRRCAAMLYDAVAVTAVIYFAAFVPVVAAGRALPPGDPLFATYLLAVGCAYFTLCWRRGRTIGMQAWKLEIVSESGGRPDLRACLLRFACAWLSAAALGLGYLVALLDPERRTWHDRCSRTRLLLSVPRGS